jgi:hypothetical protein
MKAHIFEAKIAIISLLAITPIAALMLFALSDTPRQPDSVAAGEVPSPENSPRTPAQLREAFGRVPLSFEANRGQAHLAVNFRARGEGYTLSLSSTEAVFALAREINEPSSTVVSMKIVAANPDAAVEGVNELEGKVNYLLGNDPARWRTNIPTFSRVRYCAVYPGIDLVYYGNQRRLEYDFMIAPGSDAGAIALEFFGAERMEIEDATGDLLLGIGEKTIRQLKPVVYQETGAGRRNIEGRYALLGDGRVGFEVGAYDRGTTLIIDPVLVYSTFLGGDSDTTARAIALDASGNAYVIGGTFSTDFPTANAFQSTLKGDSDAVVTKLNAAGTAVVYSTYLGGSGGEEAIGIALDAGGNAYVIGNTGSTDFPTANALQGTFGGDASGSGTAFGDAFVSKLNADGSALIYSTYLGGSDLEVGSGIALDSDGNAYVTGSTLSTNFPTANAFQGTFAGGFAFGDAFVTKFNSAGSALVYSTYLGGSGEDNGRAIAVDSAGNAYIAGRTGSGNFPTVNAFQSTYGGVGDAFVTKLNPAGSALVYSTFLGGSGSESNRLDCLAIDSSGNAYVTGQTASTNFPTANAFQSTLGGGSDIYVAKLNAAGSGLIYSSYLGGSETDSGSGIAADSAGNAYVTGDTSSTNFPTANAFQNTFGGGFPVGDGFVTKLNATGTLMYSSYLGGSEYDTGYGIAVDGAGDAYVTGITLSRCFPTTAGAFDTRAGGVFTGFIAKISESAPAAALAPCPSQLLNISTRMRVGTDPNQLIGGFIITGSQPKTVIILATGPSLAAFGLQGVLADPVLELFQGNTLIVSNDNWKIPEQAEIEATQLQPSHDLESALVRTLDPGAYTAIVRGTNGTGIGTVQIYDLSSAANSKLANISSRGLVQPGDDNVMIAGFIIGNGSSNSRVVARALGPSLAAFGIAGIPDPTLELKNAQGTTLLDNDNWQEGAAATEINGRGLAPGDLESALAISLPNGGYTAIVRGKGTASGVAVVEVYNVE